MLHHGVYLSPAPIPPSQRRLMRPSADILFVLLFAALWAWMEVLIEGKDGWAQKLPTGCAVYGWTWYHICMNVTVIVVLLRGLDCVRFDRDHENPEDTLFALCGLCVLSDTSIAVYDVVVQGVKIALYTVTWFVVEDVLWFVFNSYYGILKYTVDDVPWHASKTWVAGIFVYNWIALFSWLLTTTFLLSPHLLVDMTCAIIFILFFVFGSYCHPQYYNSPVVTNSGCWN